MTSLREEINNKLEKLWSIKTSYFSTENYNFDECITDIIKIFEKRIDEKILSIKKDRMDTSHDFECNSNLESQIEMLEEWKEEILEKK